MFYTINCFCSRCAEEGKWIDCTKDVDNGAARLEERRRRPQARIMEVVKEG